MPEKRKKASIKEVVITISLIVINAIVFFYHSLMYNRLSVDTSIAQYLLDHGANFYPKIIDGEYYRWFTCMFLHFDATHLFTNMLSLYAIGSVIEKAFGKAKFLLLYLISGLGASIVSTYYHMSKGVMAVCAGASGAVFGLAGALIGLAIFKQTERFGIDSRRVPIAIIVTLVLSSASRDGLIDVAAHIGGLVVGLLLSILLIAFGLKKPEQ